MSLSDFFAKRAREQFAFLKTDFGFEGPTVDQQSWQSTTLYYLKGSMSVIVNLDMEESIMVSIALWKGRARARYPADSQVHFPVSMLARHRDPAWPLQQQSHTPSEADVERVLASDAAALITHGSEVLRGEVDTLGPFLVPLSSWPRPQ